MHTTCRVRAHFGRLSAVQKKCVPNLQVHFMHSMFTNKGTRRMKQAILATTICVLMFGAMAGITAVLVTVF
jgi:hypothetical protein